MSEIKSNISKNMGLDEFPQSEDMPVIAGGIVPEWFVSNPDGNADIIKEYLKSAEECGFNMGTIYAEPDKLVEFFHQFQCSVCSNHLKLFLSSPLLNKSTGFEDNKAAIEKLKIDICAIDVDKILAGFNVKSEPKFDMLQGVGQYYDFLQIYPYYKIETLMTLIGVTQADYTEKGKTYEEYLNEVLNKISDLTPLLPNQKIFFTSESLNKEGSFPRGAEYCESALYYENLLALLRVSSDRHVPFWTYCNCMQLYTKIFEKTTADGETYYHAISLPAMTLETLRYKIFTAFAYGSHGLFFYDYSRRKSNEIDFFGETLADTDMTGDVKTVYKSPEWYAAKQVISEVRRYQSIFKDSVIASVRHIEKETVKKDEPKKVIEKTYYDTESATSIDSRISVELIKDEGKTTVEYSSKGAGIVVSRIGSSSIAGGDWLMIVNRSPYSPQELFLTFDDSSVVEKTTAKVFISGGKDQDFFDPSETSGILSEDVVSDMVDGKVMYKVQQKRVLYPGAYIIFQIV